MTDTEKPVNKITTFTTMYCDHMSLAGGCDFSNSTSPICIKFCTGVQHQKRKILQVLSFEKSRSKLLYYKSSPSHNSSLSLITGRGEGDRSPPRSSPGSSTGVLDCFVSAGWATTPAELGHALGSVGPDVLLFRRLHYSVDRWRNPIVQ